MSDGRAIGRENVQKAMDMHPQRHTPFETWQADVMRTLVDAGPLATSYFSSTERHQETLNMARTAQAGNGATRSDPGSLLAAARQRGRLVAATVIARLQSLRPVAVRRGAVARRASVQAP